MIEQLAILLGRAALNFRGKERLLRRLYPATEHSGRFVRGVRSRADGLQFDADSRQVIDWSMLFLGEYEPHMRRLFQALVEPQGVVLDVGANVGAHTLTLANLVGPNGKVLAFEPNPAINRKLARNVGLNRFSNVAIHQLALGEAEGVLQLRVPAAGTAEFSNPGMASLVALDSPHDLVDVGVRRCDDIVRDERLGRVDVVKIDVQGFEMQVLRGMAKTIGDFHPVILFEFEDWAWEKAGSKLVEAVDFFATRSYGLWEIEAGSDFVLRAFRGGVARPHVELLAIHRDDCRIALLRDWMVV